MAALIAYRGPGAGGCGGCESLILVLGAPGRHEIRIAQLVGDWSKGLQTG